MERTTFITESDGKFGLITEYPEFESCSPNYFEAFEVFRYSLLEVEYDSIAKAEHDLFIVTKGEKSGIVRALCFEAEWIIPLGDPSICYLGSHIFGIQREGAIEIEFIQENIRESLYPTGEIYPFYDVKKPPYTVEKWSQRQGDKDLWVIEERPGIPVDLGHVYLDFMYDKMQRCFFAHTCNGDRWMILFTGNKILKKRSSFAD